MSIQMDTRNEGVNLLLSEIDNDERKQKYFAADLDQALEVAGLGWYNLKYCAILALFLIASLMEFLGPSLTLPAAVCDLEMSDGQRGLVISLSYIGVLLTSHAWGYLVDTQGRKKILIYSSVGAGAFGILAGLMPNLISFATFRFLSSLCIACPSSTPFIYVGEILPLKYRDVFLSVLNSIQLAGSALMPVLAWAILTLDFRVPFGLYIFRPWRLLNMVYSGVFILIAILLTCGPESPKYLVSQDKCDEALYVLQKIYAGNKGKRPEEYPITKLVTATNRRIKGSFLTTLKSQTVPFLKWSYLKWILLNGFLLFGVNFIIIGLNVWVPEVLNRVLMSGAENKTACEIINDKINQTSMNNTKCNDTIDELVLLIAFLTRLCCTVIAVIISFSVKYIGKKALIITSFLFIGVISTATNLIRERILFAVVLSSSSLIVLTVGPINAYTVEIFPTHLRGMAVSLSMMLGRIGSVAGSNYTGLLINNSCEILFYSFSGLIVLCVALALMLLPSSKKSTIVQRNK